MDLFTVVGGAIYAALGAIALWGAFCAVLTWMRIAQHRFDSEASQEEFLDEVDRSLERADFDGATRTCEGDVRALPQLMELAIAHRAAGYGKVKQLVVDRFQRDVLADLEYRVSWITAVIKTAPMLGLLGTVVGMMGAFGKLDAEGVKAEFLAREISFALITTAIGLVIAIPLVLVAASINVRVRRLEDLVAAGLTRFLESFRKAIDRT